MPVDRPTFSESWYRVAQLRPRLRATVQVYRQHYRGQMWHVIQDPGSNQFHRLSSPAYHLVALLDGRRTVADAWRTVSDALGDEAPTQGEAIQLMGQLYTSNLLQADLPPDAKGLFERYRRRVRREVQGYLMNLLFIRIPLYDPDAFLDRWVGVFGKAFTVGGLIAWLFIVGTGLYFVGSHIDELLQRASPDTILAPSNLPLLYVAFVLIKVFHEFGHGFACKKFGRKTGSGGEVHTMGVMFLVFTPLPYVDASSAWALRDKKHRMLVGGAGILVELAIASLAAAVWANVGPGAVKAVAYNMMFIASVSTLLFNGNPLLRFDGYYILSDALEIPNLAQRSKDYLYYLVKRYVWGVRRPQNPAHTRGERWWLVSYAIASTAYRTMICAGILLFVARKLFILGALLATVAIISWVFVPLGKLLHYLFVGPELHRVRGRALATTALFVAAIVGAVGFVDAPDRCRVEGVVEPVRLAVINPEEDGFLGEFLPSGTPVRAGDVLVRLRNYDLAIEEMDLKPELFELAAERRVYEVRRSMAQTAGETAAAQRFEKRLELVDRLAARAGERVDALVIRSPIDGTWISSDIDLHRGTYLSRGGGVGLVASLDDVFIRAAAGQTVVAELQRAHEQGTLSLEIRVRGLPDEDFGGRVRRFFRAGKERLPSAALGYSAGGLIPTDPTDARGMRTADPFFEIHVTPDRTLLPGQRVLIRFATPAKPLAAQAWRAIWQMVHQRFYQ